MKRNKTIIKEINKHYGAELAFLQDDFVKVTGEQTYHIKDHDIDFDDVAIDYYPEYRNNGYSWIDEWLVQYAEKQGKYWEWDNPAVIVLAK